MSAALVKHRYYDNACCMITTLPRGLATEILENKTIPGVQKKASLPPTAGTLPCRPQQQPGQPNVHLHQAHDHDSYRLVSVHLCSTGVMSLLAS